MAVIFEREEGKPAGPDDRDGMQAFMADLDEPTSTDWDVSCEDPPHAGWSPSGGSPRRIVAAREGKIGGSTGDGS